MSELRSLAEYLREIVQDLVAARFQDGGSDLRVSLRHAASRLALLSSEQLPAEVGAEHAMYEGLDL